MGRNRKSAGLSAQPNLLSLPDDVISNILRRLPFKDRVRAARIGRTFHDLLSHPRAGDLVWERCEISDFPNEGYLWIARWLVQRRAGIKTISYHHLSAQEEGSTADWGAFVSEDRDQHMRNGKDFLANHAKYGMNLIPLVAGLAPELELELYDEAAKELFDFEEGMLEAVYNPYWASLARWLTRLKLSCVEAIPPEGAAALSQLSALQSLDIYGSRINMLCDISFSLPQVTGLSFGGQKYGILDLDCPKLQAFHLVESSVQNVFGVSTSLRRLVFLEVGFPQKDSGSDFDDVLNLSCMFPVSKMQGLEALTMDLSGRLTDRQLFGNLNHLTKLTLLDLYDTCMTETAFPTALPNSLVHLMVRLTYDIPQYLERLPQLQEVKLYMPGTPARLTRPLSPFLAMPGLTSLAFKPEDEDIGWHPQTLGIFRQALIDINDSGSNLQLTF